MIARDTPDEMFDSHLQEVPTFILAHSSLVKFGRDIYSCTILLQHIILIPWALIQGCND